VTTRCQACCPTQSRSTLSIAHPTSSSVRSSRICVAGLLLARLSQGWVIFIASTLWLACYSEPTLAEANILYFVSINGVCVCVCCCSSSFSCSVHAVRCAGYMMADVATDALVVERSAFETPEELGRMRWDCVRCCSLVPSQRCCTSERRHMLCEPPVASLVRCSEVCPDLVHAVIVTYPCDSCALQQE
jgi:hypothetical protein